MLSAVVFTLTMLTQKQHAHTHTHIHSLYMCSNIHSLSPLAPSQFRVDTTKVAISLVTYYSDQTALSVGHRYKKCGASVISSISKAAESLLLDKNTKLHRCWLFLQNIHPTTKHCKTLSVCLLLLHV